MARINHKYLALTGTLWGVLILSLPGCVQIRGELIKIFSGNYKPDGTALHLEPEFVGADQKRQQVKLSLIKIMTADSPTGIQFPPGSDSIIFVTEKDGVLRWHDWRKKQGGELLKLDVVTDSEMGLLGLAFHPEFQKSGLFYLNYNFLREEQEYTRISEWRLSNFNDLKNARATNERIILELKQPYTNHNGGQLAFGPDGMLYIGLGDGGWADDPHGHGQNGATLLGTMLRIDVNSRKDGAYTIPADNPFVKNKKFRPEIWAFGLRNPWRYSFGPDGRLVAADVGQDKWEEINIIEAGKNYGWNTMEGFHCFATDSCQPQKYAAPIYEYGHDEGRSITGGYVYSGQLIPELKGKYIFGDFVDGKIWALTLPTSANQRVKAPIALGRWNLLISTFGRDNRGEIYLADYFQGTIFRLNPVH